MPGFIVRCVALGVLSMGAAIGQGTFGQIAYGGCWQTTFTFANLNAQNTANVTLAFYGDDGSQLSAPVQGVGNISSYLFTIPPNGSRTVVLTSTDPNATQGWANMTTAGVTVRGQGSFLCRTPGRPDYEAVIPLTTPGTPGCIVAFPPPSDPVILLPFNNTGGHVTALAFANTTSMALPVVLEFADESSNLLVTSTLTLDAMHHTAFALSEDSYPALKATKGILRIHASPTTLTVLGLIFNFSGPFTTIMPIIQ